MSVKKSDAYANAAAKFSMKWYKFLINFALFAGAVLNLIGGIMNLTGKTVYLVGWNSYFFSGNAYSAIKGLQGLDIIMGILMIGLAIICIIARFRLSGFYKNGPSWLIAVLSACIVVNSVFIISLWGITLANVDIKINTVIYAVSIVVSIVMILLNNAYFRRRESVLVN